MLLFSTVGFGFTPLMISDGVLILQNIVAKMQIRVIMSVIYKASHPGGDMRAGARHRNVFINKDE